MKKIMLLTIFFAFLGMVTDAQGLKGNKNRYNAVKDYFTGRDTGVVTIINDPQLDTLIYRHIQSRAEIGGLRGYRIQVYFGSGRQARKEANESKASCISLFPTQKAHILYQTPFYKVRVGDFRTRNEAFIWHKKIVRKFPKAYIVNDIINFPEL
jgi:hypothetical protein